MATKSGSILQLSLIHLMGACAVLAIAPPMASAFVYGLPASVTDFPYIVALYDGRWLATTSNGEKRIVPFCTGTIVASKYVLTTHACLRDEQPYFRIYREERISTRNLLLLAGTAYGPIDFADFFRYTHREAYRFVFTKEEDHYEAYEIPDPVKLSKVHGRNFLEYFVFEKDGTKHKRWYLDFALIEVHDPWQWSRYILPAIFPTYTADVSRLNWKDKVRENKAGRARMPTCYTVGWGVYSPEFQQVRLRKAEVYFVNYDNCELSYCAQCSFCNKTLAVDPKVEKCYKSVVHGDACSGDDGAPIWCPEDLPHKEPPLIAEEVDVTSVKGYVVGILSYWRSCYGHNIPSIYQHIWNAYELISREVGYKFPPNVWVYDDWLGQ